MLWSCLMSVRHFSFLSNQEVADGFAHIYILLSFPVCNDVAWSSLLESLKFKGSDLAFALERAPLN